MTQVPTTDWNSRKDGETGTNEAPVQAQWMPKGTVRHTFTHFHLELEVWTAEVTNKPPQEGWWCATDQLAEEALPTVMRKVLQAGLDSPAK